MTGKIEHVEVITSVQRWRRWSAEEEAGIVQETYADVGVAGGAAAWDRAKSGVHLAAALRERRAVGGRGRRGVVAASEYRGLQHQVRELQRLLARRPLLAPPRATKHE